MINAELANPTRSVALESAKRINAWSNLADWWRDMTGARVKILLAGAIILVGAIHAGRADNFTSVDIGRIATMQADPKWMAPIFSARLCRLERALARAKSLSRTSELDDGLSLTRRMADLNSKLRIMHSRRMPCGNRIIRKLIDCLPSDLVAISEERCEVEPIVSFVEADTGQVRRTMECDNNGSCKFIYGLV